MVVIDTNILISAIRGNNMALTLLRKHKENAVISIVTRIELSVGATNKGKQEAVNRVLGTHEVLPLSRHIGEKALKLVVLYCTPQRRLYLPDALIAATCMEYNAALLTFNTKDFDFIKGLSLAG